MAVTCNQCGLTVCDAQYLETFLVVLGTCNICGVTSCLPDTELQKYIDEQVTKQVQERIERQTKVRENKGIN